MYHVEDQEECKLYGKFKKCEFWLEKVHFLGHVILKEGVDPTKVKAIVNWPRRMTITKVQSFVGNGRLLPKICRRIP